MVQIENPKTLQGEKSLCVLLPGRCMKARRRPKAGRCPVPACSAPRAPQPFPLCDSFPPVPPIPHPAPL